MNLNRLQVFSYRLRFFSDGFSSAGLPAGPEPFWRRAAESRSDAVSGEAGRRLPDRRAVGLPGLRAEADGCQGHQEVR